MTRRTKRYASDKAWEAVHTNTDDVQSFRVEDGSLAAVDDDLKCREKRMQIQGLPKNDYGCTRARQLVETYSGCRLLDSRKHLTNLPSGEIQNDVVSQIVEESKIAEHHPTETVLPRNEKEESV